MMLSILYIGFIYDYIIRLGSLGQKWWIPPVISYRTLNPVGAEDGNLPEIIIARSPRSHGA